MPSPTVPLVAAPDVAAPLVRGQGRGDTARGAALSGIRALVLVTWLFIHTAAVPPLVHQQWRAGGTVTAGVVLVLLHSAMVLFALLRHPTSRRLFWPAGVVLMIALVLLLPARATMHPINYWAPGYWGLVWFTWSTMVLTRRGYVRLTAVLMPVLVLGDALWTVLTFRPLHAVHLAPSPWIFFPALLMVIFCDGLLRMAGDIDDEAEQRARTLAESREHTAEVDARSEAARLLHDHVLHALHALSRPRGLVSPAMARQECIDAVAAIGGHPVAEAAVPLAGLIAADPLLGSSGAELSGHNDPVPPDVAHAMAAATHEALANAVAHAGSDDIRVQLWQEGEQRRVVVADDGVGFDPAEARPGRLGLQESITARMADVGGVALVHSAPGRGTRVELAWPRRRVSGPAERWSVATNAALRRQLAFTALPGSWATVLMTLLLAHTVHPTWAVLLLATVQLVAGMGGVLLVRRRALRGLDAVLLLAVSLGTWFHAVALAPDHVDSVYQLWLAWGSAGLLHLVVLQLPLRRGLAVLFGWVVLMAGALVVRYRHVDWLALHPLVTTGAGEAVVTLLALTIARRLSRLRFAERQALESARASIARVRLQEQTQQHWSQRVTGEAVPLLAAVAEGRADPDDEDVRARALRLEATLRDELVLGPDQAPLIGALARARDAGWQLTTPLVNDQDVPRLATLARLLDLLGAPAAPGQAVMLSTSDQQVAAVVLAPSPAQAEHWRGLACQGIGVELDEEFARLRTTPGPAPVQP